MCVDVQEKTVVEATTAVLSLQSHILSVHERKHPLICKHAGCSKRFAVKQSLTSHVVMHDPDRKKIKIKVAPSHEKWSLASPLSECTFLLKGNSNFSLPKKESLNGINLNVRNINSQLSIGLYCLQKYKLSSSVIFFQKAHFPCIKTTELGKKKIGKYSHFYLQRLLHGIGFMTSSHASRSLWTPMMAINCHWDPDVRD